MTITVTRQARIGDMEETKTATIEVADDINVFESESPEQKAVRMSSLLFQSMDREIYLNQ